MNTFFLLAIMVGATINFSNAGYCFTNDTDTEETITIYDQNNDLVIDKFLLKQDQILILSNNYLQRQKICALKIHSTEATPDNVIPTPKTSVYMLYSLDGTILSTENYTIPSNLKNNIANCIFIKRGFAQQGYFFRNIEKDKDLIITIEKNNNKPIQKKTLSPNSELYLSSSFLDQLRNEGVKIKIFSNLCSSISKQKILLNEMDLPENSILFDAQRIYQLAIGLLALEFRFPMDQFGNPKQKKVDTSEGLYHFFKQTLFNAPRMRNPHIATNSYSSEPKCCHIILRNKEQKSYLVTIVDQNNETVIKEIVLQYKETLHFASTYFKEQSITRLTVSVYKCKGHNELVNKFHLTPSIRDPYYCETYSLSGECIKLENLTEYMEQTKPYCCKSIYIKRGFISPGYFIRNIDKNNLIITVKTDHNHNLLENFTLPPNGELFFSNKFLNKYSIEHIWLTAHIDNQQKKPTITTLIRTRQCNFDCDRVYNLYGTLKKFEEKIKESTRESKYQSSQHKSYKGADLYDILQNLNMIPIQYEKNQFDEPSTKPLNIYNKILEKFLFNKSLLYQQRTQTPYNIKNLEVVKLPSTEKECSGPISPSTKI